MNRRIKKLQLSKETLRTLSERDLLRAAGGISTLCTLRCEPTEDTCMCTDNCGPTKFTNCC
jgi:hypothetical protein